MFASYTCLNPPPSLHPGLERKTLWVMSESLSFSFPSMSSLMWGWGGLCPPSPPPHLHSTGWAKQWPRSG